MEDFVNHLKAFPVPVVYGVVAIVGGCARYLNGFVDGKKFSFRVFMASAFVAGFSGFMFALLGDTLHLPYPMPDIMAGVGGFFGDQTMKMVYEYFSIRISQTVEKDI